MATGLRRILQAELSVLPDGWTLSLRGCGLLVVNPPFGFEAEAQAVLDWLSPALSQTGDREPHSRSGVGSRVRWLVPE